MVESNYFFLLVQEALSITEVPHSQFNFRNPTQSIISAKNSLIALDAKFTQRR